MLVLKSKLVKWEDFVKQLEPEELNVYSHIKFMAQELGEPQEISLEGITIGILWPSGAFQPAYRIPDCQKPTLEQFLDGADFDW